MTSWTQLVAPAGGRTHFETSIASHSTWTARYGVWHEEVPHTGGPYRRSKIYRVARDGGAVHIHDVPGALYAVAARDDGTLAWSDGQRVHLEGGVVCDFAGVDALCFGAAGDLWARNNLSLARIDPRTGAVRWSVKAWGSHLALDGDRAVLASWGSLTVVTGAGDATKLATALAHEVTALTVTKGVAWVASASDRTRTLARWNLDAHTEETFALPDGVPIRELAAAPDGTLAWRDVPAGLLVWKPGDGDPRPVNFPSEATVGLCAGDDGTTWRAVLEWMSASVVIDRATGLERGVIADLPTTLWGLSITNDGRVATAHDGAWRVFHSAGALAHHHPHDGQVTDVCFSPDGATLAVLRNVDDTVALDLVDTATFTVRATHTVSAGKVLWPDGDRLALVDGATITLHDAATMGVQCVLQHTKRDDHLRAVVHHDGRFAATDSSHRVVVFDDPGPCAVTKKPAKHKPAFMTTTSAVFPTTEAAENHTVSAVCPHGGQVWAFDGNLPGLVALDPATKKPASREKGPRGYFALDATVHLRVGDTGSTLWRLGDRAPRATWSLVPERVAASPDGRTVAVALHGGVWRARLDD